MSTRRLLAFTGSRSDYDLLSGLFARLHRDPELTLGLVVAGAHLSPTYGYTVRHIEQDGLSVVARVESLLDADSPASRLKSASILLQGCLHSVEAFRPDVILFAGDREDAIVAALVAAYLDVVSVHFFGGDHATDGNVDNAVRHASSKLASLHFVAHESHRRRLLAMGEPSRRIFVVGSPALDKFVAAPRNERRDVLVAMGQPEWDEYALVVYHPILGEWETSGTHFEEILEALRLEELNAFVSFPNVDAGNKQILAVIERWSGRPAIQFYRNLERVRFINLMRNATMMIGNSSAGLVEAPAIPLGAINVGARQRGRLAAANVIFVDHGLARIRDALREVRSAPFQTRLATVRSPYGDGDSVERCHALLKQLDLDDFRRKPEDPLNLA